ncbi:MAG TPA: aminotransferase [Pseudonocardiaceae bacterium]|jgi:aspartate/methionine/tyrosine aminotransferase|nr:aminotransferase [Pseudonocardiaceae bacterium]
MFDYSPMPPDPDADRLSRDLRTTFGVRGPLIGGAGLLLRNWWLIPLAFVINAPFQLAAWWASCAAGHVCGNPNQYTILQNLGQNVVDDNASASLWTWPVRAALTFPPQLIVTAVAMTALAFQCARLPRDPASTRRIAAWTWPRLAALAAVFIGVPALATVAVGQGVLAAVEGRQAGLGLLLSLALIVVALVGFVATLLNLCAIAPLVVERTTAVRSVTRTLNLALRRLLPTLATSLLMIVLPSLVSGLVDQAGGTGDSSWWVTALRAAGSAALSYPLVAAMYFVRYLDLRHREGAQPEDLARELRGQPDAARDPSGEPYHRDAVVGAPGGGRSVALRLSPRTTREIDSPMATAYALLAHRAGERELLDLAQAAPQYPPAPEVIERIAEAAREPGGAAYVPSPGLPRLREAFAADLSRAYAGRVDPDDMVITAGCNQAFCLVAQAIAEPGDEIVEALPYYFNHDMWLRMNGVVPRYLEPGPGLVPTPTAAEALITPRTRAISLVSPGNPSGVTIPPDMLTGFAALAARHGIALILDETYRTFRGTSKPAHPLFADPAWRDTLVSLHSFSKDLAIPGYRVGAVVAGPELNREIKKLLDCVAICPPRIGQEAAWAGLTAAADWRTERAAELAGRRQWLATTMADRPGGFEVLSVGGFFAWLRHPFAHRPTDEVVRELVTRYDALALSGTAFLPDDRQVFRVSLGNLDQAAMTDFAGRLCLLAKDLA